MSTAMAMSAPCDMCGGPAMWMGDYVTGGGGTVYEVACETCDRPWTVAAQQARRGPVVVAEPLPHQTASQVARKWFSKLTGGLT